MATKKTKIDDKKQWWIKLPAKLTDILDAAGLAGKYRNAFRGVYVAIILIYTFHKYGDLLTKTARNELPTGKPTGVPTGEPTGKPTGSTPIISTRVGDIENMRVGDKENKRFSHNQSINKGPLVGQSEPSCLIGCNKTIDFTDEIGLKSWKEYLDNLKLESKGAQSLLHYAFEDSAFFESNFDKDGDRMSGGRIIPRDAPPQPSPEHWWSSQCRGDPCGRPKNNGIQIVVVCRPLRGLLDSAIAGRCGRVHDNSGRVHDQPLQTEEWLRTRGGRPQGWTRRATTRVAPTLTEIACKTLAWFEKNRCMDWSNSTHGLRQIGPWFYRDCLMGLRFYEKKPTLSQKKR